MDYLLTFEDGSEALTHHGVKGMKWGVWNEETRDRYSGEKRPSLAESIADCASRVNRPRSDEGWQSVAAMTGEIYDPEARRATNCACCGLAYEMRRRGFDVQGGLSEVASSAAFGKEHDIGRYFEGATYSSASGIQDLNEQLKDMPEGSRGILYGRTYSGTEHIINWEVQNGQVVYADGQNGKTYSKDEVSQLYPDEYPSEWEENYKKKTGTSPMEYVRTDNLKANVERLNRDAAIRDPNESERKTAVRTAVASFTRSLDNSCTEEDRAYYRRVGQAAVKYALSDAVTETYNTVLGSSKKRH